MSIDSSSFQHMKDVAYSSRSKLNTLDLCIPSPHREIEAGHFWVIYIHGGAWRDPKITSTSFARSQTTLLASPAAKHIAGLASLNYRLSPHPDHPAPPDDPARNAKHPDHINDILDALRFLQAKYHFGSQYILAGHSCGATLALQVAMSRTWITPAPNSLIDLQLPQAIVGIEGIYDLPALVAYNAPQPVYETFTTGAFGPRFLESTTGSSRRDVWTEASPTSGRYRESWAPGRLVLIAHSRADELVEWEQVDLIQAALSKEGWTTSESSGKRLVVLELKGSHDGVWEDGGGEEVARAIQTALEAVAPDQAVAT